MPPLVGQRSLCRINGRHAGYFDTAVLVVGDKYPDFLCRPVIGGAGKTQVIRRRQTVAVQGKLPAPGLELCAQLSVGFYARRQGRIKLLWNKTGGQYLSQ